MSTTFAPVSATTHLRQFPWKISWKALDAGSKPLHCDLRRTSSKNALPNILPADCHLVPLQARFWNNSGFLKLRGWLFFCFRSNFQGSEMWDIIPKVLDIIGGSQLSPHPTVPKFPVFITRQPGLHRTDLQMMSRISISLFARPSAVSGCFVDERDIMSTWCLKSITQSTCACQCFIGWLSNFPQSFKFGHRWTSLVVWIMVVKFDKPNISWFSKQAVTIH